MVLHVPAMSCAHCEKTITKLLSELPEVDSVEADASAKELRIKGRITLESVNQALTGTPYTAELKE